MRKIVLLLVALVALSAGENAVDARRKDKAPKPPTAERKEKTAERKEKKENKAAAAAAALAPATPAPEEPASFGRTLHWALLLVHFGLLAYIVQIANHASDRKHAFRRSSAAMGAIFVLEALAQLLAPAGHVSVGVMVFVSVVFTISPVEEEGRPFGLHMGTVPPLCVLWLGAVGVLGPADLVRALYGSDTLRPYHLVVMFLGSVYLCTALERSGFLHTAAQRVVEKYGRSPWGLFWALGCFSGTLTVLIPDDIVTMTLTPITIRMCQLLNLPEIPYLFSQFFAGNIWAVTLVTGNPTNVLLAEDLKDTFVSFAGRMGVPGICAGLTSFVLMWLTNRHVVNQAAESTGVGGQGTELKGMMSPTSPDSSSDEWMKDASGKDTGSSSKGEAIPGGSGKAFTNHGVFCLLRVITATLFCALENFHGLPVYLVVLIMGIASFVFDVCVSLDGALDVLRHMPWELFSFVTGFLVLAEAMSLTGVSLWMATIFLPLATSRSVAYVSGFTTMLFCNVFETLPATLIVFKMIDSVPQWKAEAIAGAAVGLKPLLTDARRAALSAVIFGSNFGANTACIGSLGGLMMRRLALQQGVSVTNGMLLKQGIPVMIPTMLVACFVLIHQKNI